ncbi:ATP-NAD kinase [Sistotremastrum suecicum HHB10207 ss-3]|uniref:ATP-NAD kinase n=1 Tax=Sistotremastrum suecicum HHB10207 ss-3 TaxID=1314776 RepID=A0A165YP16_9AGAM|nr:ATP-NAD kinase [Sistotremastrum suecicum HHB10207 ss-3]
MRQLHRALRRLRHIAASSSSDYSSGRPILPPKSILFVKKRNDKIVAEALTYVLSHLQKVYPTTKLYHSTMTDPPDGLEHWSPQSVTPIDLVVTLGGDGTILRASSLFRRGRIPPVLSFSMGSLGFLLPFHIDSFPKVLARIFAGEATTMERMRLGCTFLDAEEQRTDGWQVMNEVTLHRGRSAHLNRIDAYVDGTHLTEAVSDGLIVATPTGSTAYSLSSGGPIVHPSVRTILLTPICPRSLSFRPLLLPGTSEIQLRVHKDSRAPAEVSMDGQEARTLHPGESVKIRVSRWPVPCVARWSPSASSRVTVPPQDLALPVTDGEDEWVRDINTLLQFNAAFRNKALLRHAQL